MNLVDDVAGQSSLVESDASLDKDGKRTPEHRLSMDAVQPIPAHAEQELSLQQEAIEAADEKQEENKAPFLQAMGGAVINEWSPSWHLITDTPEIDPDFRMTPEFYQDLTKDVPEEFHEWFDNVVSEDHGYKLKEQMRMGLSIDEDLAQYGAWSFSMRMVAAAFDPAAIAASVATEGALAPLILAQKANRLRRVVTRGAIAAGTNAATESVLVSGKPTGQWSDVAIAGLAGFGLGSLGEAFNKGRSPEIKEAFEAVANVTEKQTKRLEALAKLKVKVEELKASPHVGDASATTAGSINLDEVLEQLARGDRVAVELPEETLGLLHEAMKGSGLEDLLQDSAGAMRAYAYDIPLREDSAERILSAEKAAPPQERGMGASTRWDAVGQNLRSTNPVVRELTSKLSPNSTGHADSSRVGFTAAEDQGRIQSMYQVKFQKNIGKAAHTYIREQGVPVGQREQAWNEFMELVGQAVENPKLDVPPAVKQAANSYSEMMDELYSLAHRPGQLDGSLEVESVKGFDQYRPVENYLTRIYDHLGIQRLISQYGTSGTERLLKGSIESAMEKAGKVIDEEVTSKLAYWHLRSLRTHSVGGDSLEMRKLSGEDKEGLRELLTDAEHGAGLSESQVGDVLAALEKPQEGAHSRAKHRLLLDPAYSLELKSRDGAVSMVSINQLYKRNVGEIFESYLRQISGAIAMARQGFRTPSEFIAEVDRIPAHADALRERGVKYSERKMKLDMENLRFMHDHVRGNTMWGVKGDTAHGMGWRLTNALLGYNYTRVMNMTGLAQIPELANVVGHLGIKTLYRAIPSFRALTRQARAGKLSDEFLDELEDFTGLGTQVMRDVPTDRYEDFGTTIDPQEHQVLTKIEKLVDKGKRITTKISGMAHITDFSYRLAMPGEARLIIESAMGWKKVNLKRLKADGLDEELLRRIGEQVKKHADIGAGQFTKKTKVRQLRWADWDDQEAAYAMQMAIYRSSRRMVQASDAGDLNRLMTHPVGRVLTQFRSFVLVSWAKQLGYQLRMHDKEAAVAILGQLLLGGMVYLAQTHIKATGKGEAEKREYLKERLKDDQLIWASIQRTGPSSILPGVVDSVRNWGGYDPLFAGRTTGLATDFLTGSPTVDTWKKVEKGVLEAGGEAVFQSGDRWTQGEAKALMSLAPFSNALGIINAINVATSDLPKRD